MVGALVAVNKSIVSEYKYEWQTTVEDLWVRIKLKNYWINICLAYLPSYLTSEHYLEFLDNCERILSLSADAKHLMIGDFNLGDIDWSGSLNGLPQSCSKVKSVSLNEFMVTADMVQLNTVVNHNNRLLDLVLVSSELSCSVTGTVGMSRVNEHHPPLEILFKADKNRAMVEVAAPRLLFRKTSMLLA